MTKRQNYSLHRLQSEVFGMLRLITVVLSLLIELEALDLIIDCLLQN